MPLASVALDLAYAELRTNADQTDVPGMQRDIMLQKLDQFDKEYQKKFRLHGTEQSFYRKSETGFDLLPTTNLAEDVTSATTDFNVDDGTALGDIANAGAIWDQGTPDIFEYTAPVANNIPGVTGIDFPHETDDVVHKFYPMPANFHSLRGEERSPDGVTLDGNLPIRFNSSPPLTSRNFSWYDNGTTTFLWFNRGLNGTIRVTYNKIGNTIDDLGDELELAKDDHVFFHVSRLIAHGKRSRGDTVVQIRMADGKLRDKDDHDADNILREIHRERNIGRNVRTRPIRRFQFSDIYRDRSLHRSNP